MKRNASMPSIATRARQAAAPLSIAVHLHGLHGLTLQLAQPRTRQLLLLFLIIGSLFSLQSLCATANWALPALIRPQLTNPAQSLSKSGSMPLGLVGSPGPCAVFNKGFVGCNSGLYAQSLTFTSSNGGQLEQVEISKLPAVRFPTHSFYGTAYSLWKWFRMVLLFHGCRPLFIEWTSEDIRSVSADQVCATSMFIVLLKRCCALICPRIWRKHRNYSYVTICIYMLLSFLMRIWSNLTIEAVSCCELKQYVRSQLRSWK